MDKKVKIYSTPTCPYCRRAKEYLDQKGITYESIDLSTNPDAVKEMVDLTGQMGVPVIVVDEEAVVGFDKDKLEQLLS